MKRLRRRNLKKNNFDASFYVKIEPCGINITEYIKEEDTRDYLSYYEICY